MEEYIKVDYSWVEKYIPEDDPREDEIYVWEEDEDLIAFVPKSIYENIMGRQLFITFN